MTTPAGDTVPASDTSGGREDVPDWLRTSAGYAWRLLVLLLAVSVVVVAAFRIQLVLVAIFVGLVITAVLRPVVGTLSRFMPRVLATALALVGGIVTLLGLLTYVGVSVATQWSELSKKFSDGIDEITKWLEGDSLPFTITNDQITHWIDNGQAWLQQHSGDLAAEAAARAGSVVEVFTAIILAMFCSVFFLARGRQMLTWFWAQLPARVRPRWRSAFDAGWSTFSGYTRGTFIIAVTDGMLAFILLWAIGVPLAAPLGVLVLLGAFVPLIGAPSAMVVAMIVALATGGPVKAAIVGVGIALIGQFEGHVLQPIVMGRQVSLHPVVVALVVATGTITAGIVGAVVAVPAVAVSWAIYSTLRPPRDPMGGGGGAGLRAPDGHSGGGGAAPVPDSPDDETIGAVVEAAVTTAKKAES